MAPRVLISDALSPAAVQIFKDRGIEVDFQPNLGKDKEKLAEVINGFDGLAVRSATKVTSKILDRAKNLKVVGRAGIGVDNVDIPAATAKGIIVMNTPFGNSITTAEHAITLMLSLARQIPQADASTQAGKWEKNRFMAPTPTAPRSRSPPVRCPVAPVSTPPPARSHGPPATARPVPTTSPSPPPTAASPIPSQPPLP